MTGMTTVERAFALADQGLSISEIRRALKREGYNQHQIYGTAITIQLGKRILTAKARLGGFGSVPDEGRGAPV